METTNQEELVRCLIKGTIQRAIRESVACVIVLVAFGAILQGCETGTPRYYGCLLILVATGFIAGVVWSFALSYQLLHNHPVSDSGFWREAFHSQARLLRLVPLWYLAPLCSGMVLFAAPQESGTLLPFLVLACVAVAMFALLTWLNRVAAAWYEKQAAQL